MQPLTPETLTFIPVADHALMVQLGTEVSETLSAQVVALDKAIAAASPEGVQETVPAFVNLLVEFDPLVTDHAALETAIRACASRAEIAENAGTLHEVPVCYDTDLGPDLAAVAKATGMSEEAAINAHLSGDYRVGMFGFAPGYAYLSGVPEALQVPRKTAPVRGIPRGAVMIAGPQCLVTTLKMPTGWSILGRSPTEVLTQDPSRPFLFDVGDRVRFRRIDRAEFDSSYRQDAT